jgi:nitrite reductase/ring-hydroxylating ferredoxin subunit/uncharacterized membrane protein
MLSRALARLVEAQALWAQPWGKAIQRLASALLGRARPLRDGLNGTWLGHSLHAALTDLPIGALTLVVVLDIVGQSAAADIGLGLVVLAMLAAAATGIADHLDTVGRERTVTTVHGTLMALALLLLIVSLLLRVEAGSGRSSAIVLSLLGYLIVLAGAWIGGEAVFGLGMQVDRHAWQTDEAPTWRALDVESLDGDIPQGRAVRATAGDARLLLVRQGDQLHALDETCAHAGGPLADGHVVDGTIECPWHGSRFDLLSGQRRQGPTTHDQPAFEVRRSGTAGYEVRRRPA